MDEPDLVRAHCNQCAGERKHLLVHFYRTEWNDALSDDPPARIYGEDRYELLRCAGCESIALRHTSYHSEITNDDGQATPIINYYPPSTFRRIPSWTHGVTIGNGRDFSLVWMPEFVSRLIPEIYAALHAKSYSLAAMGVRALLESIMIQQVQDNGTFQKNMEAFQLAGNISKRQREALEATLELGHASIHRGFVPSKLEIIHSLDIVEGLIEVIYINGVKGEALKRRVPPKLKRSKKKP